MLTLTVLVVLLEFCAALSHSLKRGADKLLVLDTGVGHRSTPIPQWRTSLRSLSTRGLNASILHQFGPKPSSSSPTEPIGAYSLAYSLATGFAFLATGEGIIRADLNDNEYKIIVTDQDGGQGQITSVTVAEQEKKIYYGTLYEGLIKKANFDGSNVETVRNVSQGINWNILPSYTPANSYADGILVDEDQDFLYFSASRQENGSIRRVPLKSSGKEQVLVKNIDMPGQIRLVRDASTYTNSLWWTEKGRWSSSPTALKLLDLSKLPSTGTAPPSALATTTMIQSSQSSIFFEKDYTGENQTLSIQSFVVYRDQISQTVFLALESAGRTILSKLVAVTWQGSGGGRKAVLTVLNEETKDLGVPVGLEYVP